MEEESRVAVWGRYRRGRVLGESSPGRIHTCQDGHVAGV